MTLCNQASIEKSTPVRFLQTAQTLHFMQNNASISRSSRPLNSSHRTPTTGRLLSSLPRTFLVKSCLESYHPIHRSQYDLMVLSAYHHFINRTTHVKLVCTNLFVVHIKAISLPTWHREYGPPCPTACQHLFYIISCVLHPCFLIHPCLPCRPCAPIVDRARRYISHY